MFEDVGEGVGGQSWAAAATDKAATAATTTNKAAAVQEAAVEEAEVATAEETAEEAAATTDKVALAAEMDHMEMTVRECNGGVLVCGREQVRGQHVDWRKEFGVD